MDTLRSVFLWLSFFVLALLALTCLFAPIAMGGAPMVIGWGLAYLFWKAAQAVLVTIY